TRVPAGETGCHRRDRGAPGQAERRDRPGGPRRDRPAPRRRLQDRLAPPVPRETPLPRWATDPAPPLYTGGGTDPRRDGRGDGVPLPDPARREQNSPVRAGHPRPRRRGPRRPLPDRTTRLLCHDRGRERLPLLRLRPRLPRRDRRLRLHELPRGGVGQGEGLAEEAEEGRDTRGATRGVPPARRVEEYR